MLHSVNKSYCFSNIYFKEKKRMEIKEKKQTFKAEFKACEAASH